MPHAQSVSILALVALVALAAAAPGASPAVAAQPAIYLTWHAPWGYPRACDTLSTDCDTTRIDTLWLSFDSGKAAPRFLAVRGELLFHPPAGDSLLTLWTRDRDQPKPPFMRLDLGPEPGMGYPMPYKINGGGTTLWYGAAGGAMTLGFIYATPYLNAVPIERRVYVAGRLILHHGPASEPGCRQPICIEWTNVELTYDVGAEKADISSGVNRFVSLNSPGGAVSVPYRKAATLHGWKPPD